MTAQNPLDNSVHRMSFAIFARILSDPCSPSWRPFSLSATGNINRSPCRTRTYVSQLPQTPWLGLTVPPFQLHTSFSCLESDLWELLSWVLPLGLKKRALCSVHPQLHPAGSEPGLCCPSALLWPVFGPQASANTAAKITFQRRTSRTLLGWVK